MECINFTGIETHDQEVKSEIYERYNEKRKSGKYDTHRLYLY